MDDDVDLRPSVRRRAGLMADGGYFTDDELEVGCIQASLNLEYARTTVFFRWMGCDESDEVTGSGSAELNDEGMLEIELSFDNGDDALLTARRE